MDIQLILLIASGAVAFVYCAMVLCFLIGWLSTKKFTAAENKTAFKKSVTIIIPARNEEKNIAACLDSLFKQDYPKHLYEIIVVDDYSTDDTRKITRETSFPALRLFDLQQYLGNRGEKKPNKKEALSIGIKNAQGDLIVTTDGDTVRGEKWLSTLVSFYEQNQYKLITAPVVVNPAYTPLQMLQQADVISLMGITGATIHFKSPTMCSGANLLYAKETFHELEGFKGNNDVPSGDDIFLMQKVHAKYPDGIGFVKSFDATVFTRAESGLFSFISQRIRWASKSTGYATWWVKLMLLYAYLFNAATLGMAIWCGINFAYSLNIETLFPAFILLGAKLFIDLLLNIPLLFFFKKWWLIFVFPIIELLHILYILFVGLLSLSGRYRWRGRRVS